MVEWQDAGIILQHLPHLLLRETSHLIELWSQGVVSADIKATRQVIHRDRTNTRYENSAKRTARSSLDGIEEFAQISLAMCLVTIAIHIVFVGKYHIGEVVVLVDEEINLLPHLLALLAEESQLFDGSVLGIHLLFDTRR